MVMLKNMIRLTSLLLLWVFLAMPLYVKAEPATYEGMKTGPGGTEQGVVAKNAVDNLQPHRLAQVTARLQQNFSLERVSKEKIEVGWDDLLGLNTVFTKRVPVQCMYHPDAIFVQPDLSIALGDRKDALGLGFALGETPQLPDMYKTTRKLVDGYKPIVESEWLSGPLKLTQTAFGYLPENKQVTTGRETQYLMIRVKIENTGDSLQSTNLTLLLGNMLGSQSTLYESFLAPIERWQAPPMNVKIEQDCLTMDGKTLMAFKCSAPTPVSWQPSVGDFKNCLQLGIQLKPHEARTIDFTVSGRSSLYPAEELAKMKATSFERALKVARSSWDRALSTGMKLEVPDDHINDIYKAIVLSSLQNMSQNPNYPWREPNQSPSNTGVWPWEFAHMAIPMISIGYWREMEPALRFFTERQNEVGKHSANLKPPGRVATIKGSYVGSGIPWMNETGCVLWVMANQYRYSRDINWLKVNAPSILAAWEWIQTERATTRKLDENGRKAENFGLIPAGAADDTSDKDAQTNFTFTDNCTWKGMDEIARAFREARLPEADRLTREAVEYRQCILRVMHTQEFVDPETQLLFVPSTVGWKDGRKAGWWHASGCIQLFNSGFLRWDDKRFEPMVDYIRRKCGIFLGLHESCGENGSFVPYWYINQVERTYYQCYLARGEFEKALLTLYSVLVYGQSPDCHQTVERHCLYDGKYWYMDCPPHGNYSPFQPNASGNGRLIDMFRRMVIDEQDADQGRLWLLRGCPSRWFADGKSIVVRNASTLFGRMAIRSKSSGGKVTVEIDCPEAKSLSEIRLVVRHPERKLMTKATANGTAQLIDGDAVVLRRPSGHLKVVCEY